MPPRFQPGATVYAKDGRRYIVDDVADGTVYCSSPGGAETEFPEAQLLNEAEWGARSGGGRDIQYGRIKQARAYAPHKGAANRAGSEQLLSKAERVMPGILDFVAFTTASRIVTEAGNPDFAAELSIVRCREVFDAAEPEIRLRLLAGLIGTSPDVLLSAGKLGDNLMRAMIDKGLESLTASFEDFSLRRRQ